PMSVSAHAEKPTAADEELDRLEAAGVIIGEIVLDIGDVFDTSTPKENKSVFRLANRLHINTRPSTITSQLLFRRGDKLTRHDIQESARLLRANSFFYDASVTILDVTDNVARVKVTTRDNWTLLPRLSFSRSGGESRYQFGFEEQNLLGTGSSVTVERRKDDDRRSTSFEFFDRNLGRTWVRLGLEYRDNSDGEAAAITLLRPFYALDTRWSAGTLMRLNDREEPLFSRGDETGRFRQDEQRLEVYYGRSAGLINNLTRRWSFGVAIDDNTFSPLADQPNPVPLPADRELRYPFIHFEQIENRFEVAQNFDQILRTEDLYLGTRFGVRLGVLSESLGSDRDGLVIAANASSSFGSPQRSLVTVASQMQGRVESGTLVNATVGGSVTLHHRQSPKRMAFAAINGVAGRRLDIDNPILLGGNTGLRGYPRAFGNGDARAVLTLEQRYFTDWYPFRLFRVGGAAFFDIGRSWGEDSLGVRDDRILSNAGIGLRLGSTRGNSNRIVHIDLAFALRDDPQVDDVQLLIEAKRGF
ncbi:MAG: hypothetical protein AAF270_16885, partial [Pseudomonadota bacterium]